MQGVLIGYSYPWKEGITYHIQELYVSPSVRRQGVAGALVRHAMSALQAEGDVSVCLIANQQATAAHFYEHLGLSQHPYYKFYSGRLPAQG